MGDKKFKILAIDGGGIRGIIPAAVLTLVEETIQKKYGSGRKVGDYFDFIAGTSTGGILATLFLAPDETQPGKARYGAADALQLYLDNGSNIFKRSLWQRIKTLGGLLDERYDAAPLEATLKRYLGDLQSRQLLKPCLIPAYSVQEYRPFFFTQHDAVQEETENYLARAVARATAAAPTYFQPAMPRSLGGHVDPVPMIDGGVFANNPTMCALVEVLKLPHPNVSNNVQNLAIMSLGTGESATGITFKQCKDWGLAQWAKPLFDILMEGVSQTVDYQMRLLFGSNLGIAKQYLRINGSFSDAAHQLCIPGLDPALDNASPENMAKLERFGRQLAQNFAPQIEAFVDAFA